MRGSEDAVDPVIDVTNLICRYRRTEAVAGVTFTVGAGTVFALLGPNGAGKTTIIRALMNIIQPSAGAARVLGVDTRQLGPREFATIGYVSENQQMPGWMTLEELLAYCRPLYPGWDDALCSKLVLPGPPGNRVSSRRSRIAPDCWCSTSHSADSIPSCGTISFTACSSAPAKRGGAS